MPDAGGRSTRTALSSYYGYRAMLAAVVAIAFFLYLLWMYQPILTFVGVAIIAAVLIAILVSIRRGRIQDPVVIVSYMTVHDETLVFMGQETKRTSDEM